MLKKTVIAAFVGSLFALGAAHAQVEEIDGTDISTSVAHKQGGEFHYFGEAISISNKSDSSASDVITVSGGSKVQIGGAETSTIRLEQTKVGSVAALFATKTENGVGNILIEATDSIDVLSADVGLWLQSNTEGTPMPDPHTTVSLTSKNISIKGKTAAIYAFSNSELNIESTGGAIEIEGESGLAIDTRGNSIININADGKASKVILKGDIAFETPGSSDDSGSNLDSKVNIVLSGKDSFWTGGVMYGYPDNLTDEQKKVTGMHLTLENGAQWNAEMAVPQTVQDVALTTVNGAVNHLTLNNGVINVQSADDMITVDTLSGTGGTVNLAASAEDGSVTGVAELKVTTVAPAEKAPSLDVNFTGITADDIDDPEAAMKTLSAGIAATGAEQKLVVEEGDIKGQIIQVVDEEGNVDVPAHQTSNSKLSVLSSVTALSTMQWRHEMNDLTKRMGELRDSPEGVGAWARVYGSEQEYGDQSVTLKSSSVQVGADYAIGDWTVGGAFSYTDGTTDYDGGDGDTKAYGFAVYGTWMADNGMFVDLIGKYSRLENEFGIKDMSGEAKNNAYSMSAEFGWRFDLTDLVYVEPQAEMTYGRIMGDNFTTSNGVRVDQDDYDSFLGRVGLRAGLKFPEKKGSIYARISGVYDFKGESEATYTKGQSETYRDDLGGGWMEYALGANFNLTDSTYSYVDLEKSTGGEVEEKWRWNVGVRHVF